LNILDQNWLVAQCKEIDGVSNAILMLRAPEGKKLKVVAHWSFNGKGQVVELIPITNAVLLQKKIVVNTQVKDDKELNDTFDYLAIPLGSENKLCGIIAFKLSSMDEKGRAGLAKKIIQSAKYILIANDASRVAFLNSQIQDEKEALVNSELAQQGAMKASVGGRTACANQSETIAPINGPILKDPDSLSTSVNIKAKPTDNIVRISKEGPAHSDHDYAAQHDLYTDVVKLESAALEQKTYEASSRVMISELASSLECERVSIGILNHQHVRVTAISDQSNFDPRSNMVRAIADAMEEAIDQDTVISYAKGHLSKDLIDKAHAVLADQHGASTICTFPLIYNGEIFGAVILERTNNNTFCTESILMCEQFCTLIGPYLALMRSNESSLFAKIRQSINATASGFFELQNLRFKVLASVCTFLIAYICIAEGDMQVTSSAVVEGKIQRVVAAPMDGFIASSNLRAGDIVKKGDVIAILDDKDLELEHLKLRSQREKVQREYREALAKYNKTQVRILSAQAEQIDADISLVNEQLARTQIIAPFDGIIIDGDLTQSLASPVSRGELLYKIAPLEGYRIILRVDEKNILQVQDGQKGLLALASLPGKTMPMKIEKITPVAQTVNGQNTFRVEASLEEKQALMRPGMQGVARIDTGKATYIWLWTHDLIDWLRLWFWSWRP